jgi:hypothetical protein
VWVGRGVRVQRSVRRTNELVCMFYPALSRLSMVSPLSNSASVKPGYTSVKLLRIAPTQLDIGSTHSDIGSTHASETSVQPSETSVQPSETSVQPS